MNAKGDQLRIHIDQIHVGAGTQIGPVTTFPVWTAATALPGLEAPSASAVAVAELPEPRIDALSVAVSGTSPVLLAEGTLLAGGMQTRVLAHDAVIRPEERLMVEATCVEAGRWGGGTSHTLSGRVPVRVISDLRRVRRPANGRNDRAGQHDRQGRVWESVGRYEQHYGQRPTSSLLDLMEDPDDEQPTRRRYRRLYDALRKHSSQRLPGQSGVIVAIGGQPVLLEVFPSVRLFAAHLRGLLLGLAMDAAMFPDVPTPARRARRFAERLMAAPLTAMQEIPDGVIYGASVGYLDVRALDARVGQREGSAHVLAINSRHDLVLAA